MSKNFDELPAATLPLSGNEVIPANQGGQTRKLTIGQIIDAVLLGADPSGTASTLLEQHLLDFMHSDMAHDNRVALDAVEGINKGDQDIEVWLQANHPGLLALEGSTNPTLWIPRDASGLGLAFTSSDCKYIKVGNLYHLTGTITYPSGITDSINDAKIGGLPADADFMQTAAAFNPTGSSTYGTFAVNPGAYITFYNNFGSVSPRKNITLNGATVRLNIAYIGQ